MSHKIGKGNTKHGLSHLPEYKIWKHMKQRCYNENDPDYKNYGGRGIEIQIEWKNSFELFFNFVGKRPTPEHTLDRINNDGNYESGNVKWATRLEQRHNSRNISHNKLDQIKANEIRKLYGIYTKNKLADMFNISLTQISRIINHINWNNKEFQYKGKDLF